MIQLGLTVAFPVTGWVLAITDKVTSSVRKEKGLNISLTENNGTVSA